MTKATFYVYIYFRPDGRPCYIGKGSGHRWRKHLRKCDNPHLRAILKAVGGELPIVKLRNGLTEDEAFAAEAAYIQAIGREPNGPLVNMSDGGEGASGRRMAPEQIEKLRAINKGRKPTPEEIERRVSQIRGRPRPKEVVAVLVASRKGVKASEETLQRMSEARRGKPWTEAQRQARRPWSHTEESRQKISAAFMGRKQDPEFVARRIAATKLACQSEEARERRRARTKASWDKRVRVRSEDAKRKTSESLLKRHAQKRLEHSGPPP